MALFDDSQNLAFDIACTVFGVTASWTPQTTGIPELSEVFFNSPSEADKVSGTRFFPFNYEMEYRVGQFDGLIASVREGGVEDVIIDGVTYRVMDAKAFWDGKTIRACLRK